MSEADLRDERIKKLDALKAAGFEGYPATTDAHISGADFHRDFESLGTEKQVTVVGRIMAKRGQGGIMFADLFDGSEKVQCVFQADVMPEKVIALFGETADMGDFIQATGTPFTTKRGERSVQVNDWKMLAKALLPLPSEHFGIQDEELRLRERYLAMLIDPETRGIVERRSRFWNVVRAYYLEHGFMEVETPILETSPGGADARPFTTHHNALDIDVSLRISLELWLKRLLVAGFPKVFEIGRIFRNEGQSREHLQDYTQIESYEAYSDLHAGMRFIQELYRRIAKDVYGKYTFEINGFTVDFAEEWPELDYGTLIRDTFGIDPLSCSEEEAIKAVRDAQIPVGEELNLPRAVDHLWKSIRKTIGGPAFLTGVPVYMEPLAKRSEKDGRIVERMQVLIAGSEVGKGFSELNDPQDQRARFEEQQKLRDQGDDEAQRLDEEYVRAMEYGMPPAFGFGASERLFAFFENRPAHECQLFPLLRPRQ